MSLLEIILVAVGSYVFMSILVTLAVTRFMRRVNHAAKTNLRERAEQKRRLPRIHFRKSS